MSRFKKTISLILVNMSLFGCHFQKENTESKAHSDSVETSGNLKDMVGEKLKQKIDQKEENKKEIEEKERKEDREKKKDKNKSEKKEK